MPLPENHIPGKEGETLREQVSRLSPTEVAEFLAEIRRRDQILDWLLDDQAASAGERK
jgi:hypothetical protein